jgi:hypothetical protein
MTEAAVGRPASPAVPKATATAVDRLLAAVPLLTVFCGLGALYFWQAWRHGTPWLFTDELKYAQLARSIAATGHASLRDQPHSFESLYTYLTAPAWLFNDTGTAYAAAKYIGAATMTASLFPAYGLARMLVSRGPALFAAAGTAAIPAFAYSAMLVTEPLAYPYATLCLFLCAKALATRRRGYVAAAIVACAGAPWVRGELAMLPVAFLLGAVGLVAVSERNRRWRQRWSTWDWVGAAVLVAGALVAVSAVLGHESTSWYIATVYHKHEMVQLGLWAAGALAIGLGVLPFVAGLAALVRPRREPRSATDRAFVSLAVAAIVCFGLYTAVKAAYLSTVFATRVEERNLIYLCPLLFVGTAVWLERRRVLLLPLAVAAGFALYLILRTPYQMDSHFYSDATGLAILSAANRNLAWTPSTAQSYLLALLGATVVFLLAPGLLRSRRRLVAGFLSVVAALVLAWNVTAEVSAASGSNTFSHNFLVNLPRQLDWVDKATGGRPVMYLGQNISDPNGIWLLEFWNRSIRYVWSLDGTAPGPGKTETPTVLRKGQFQQQRSDVAFIVAEPGVDVYGTPIARGYHSGGGQVVPWTLYRIPYPIRIVDSADGIYSDGWMGSMASYTRYSGRGRGPGRVTVSLSRAGWGGTDVPGHVLIRIGTLGYNALFQQHIKQVTSVRRWTIHSKGAGTFVLPAPPPPFRVEVRISPTFVPNTLDPRFGDRRQLGAVIGFSYER